MIYRPLPFSYRNRIFHRIGNILFGCFRGFGQGFAEREITCQGGGEGASGAMRGGAGNLLTWKNFEVMTWAQAEQISRRIEVPTGNDHISRAHLVQLQSCSLHLFLVSDSSSSKRGSFINIGSDHVSQRQEFLFEYLRTFTG